MTASLGVKVVAHWNADPVEKWLPVTGWEEAYEVSDHRYFREYHAAKTKEVMPYD